MGNMPIRMSNKFEKNSLNESSAISANNSEVSPAHSRNKASKPSQDFNKPSVSGANNYNYRSDQPRQCFNCGSTEHLARKCIIPPKKCKNYNRPGHEAAKCSMF
ncbi:unnamed protein product [Brassicogethes aeneus]|uniref:CCHC-type domain-containing protein n=1 Tax=Brassicogethes aeneus TaxID=1431903 RepID=A0A9P0BFI1_BRAAE|nr:unnamed protein product [Brassicogethes aeneus]